MQWSKEEIEKIQKLLLSNDESNQLIGLELLKQDKPLDNFAPLLTFLLYADSYRTEVIKNIKETLTRLDSKTRNYWEEACAILHNKSADIDNFEKHIDLFDSYVKTSSRFADTYLSINNDLRRYSEFDGLDYLRKAAEFHPDHYDANYDYAYFLEETSENLDTIIKHYLCCLKIDDSYYGLYHNLGKAYVAKGDYAHAIEFFRAGLAKDPDNVDCMVELSLAVKEEGELEEARKLLESAIELDPYSHLAFNNLAFLLWDSFQEYDLAKEMIFKALEILPDHALYWHTLAEIEWYGFKNKEKALEALYQGKKHDPSYSGGDGMIEELEAV